MIRFQVHLYGCNNERDSKTFVKLCLCKSKQAILTIYNHKPCEILDFLSATSFTTGSSFALLRPLLEAVAVILLVVLFTLCVFLTALTGEWLL